METTGLNNSAFETLAVPLPEDVLKLKWCGEFEQAEKLIDRKLEKELPKALKTRLMLEKEILKRMPGQYPYTWEQALGMMRENIRDFKDEELMQLWQDDAADWIYIHGQVHFRSSFLRNLVKTRKAYEERVMNPELAGDSRGHELLDTTIEAMKAEGGQTRRFHMKITIRLKPEAERDGSKIRVYIPIPVEYAQVEGFKLLSVTIGERKAEEDEYIVAPPQQVQRTVCIETIHKTGQVYGAEFEFENHSDYVDLNSPKAIEKAAGAGADFKKADVKWEIDDPELYLGELLPHIRFSPYIKALAAEITEGETNPLVKARKIYDFVTTRVMYSYVRSYFTITDIPQYVASSLKGDCGVQALLFITLCRASGIPARWQAGLYTTPLTVGNHDWAQFYVEPFGWRFADCSFGGSAYRKQSELRWNFYFGNLEPFRLPAAREYQGDFMPLSRHLRHDPYDNQEGEVEYEDAGLTEDEFETDFDMIELETVQWESAGE